MRTVAVVVSVDEAHRLRACLPAAAPQCELVVVDDACADDSAAVARAAGATVVTLPRRVSWAAAANAGVAAALDAGAEAVLLLNADCILEPEAVVALRATLDAHPDAGIVAPLLLRTASLDPSGFTDEVDCAGMTVTSAGRVQLVGHGDPRARWSRGGPCFGGDGACVLLRASALRGLDDRELLDERLGLWGADVTLTVRLRAAGWAARYEPRAVGHHLRFYSASSRAALGVEHRRLWWRNRLLLRARTGWPPLAPAFELAALGHALARERDLLPAYAQAARAWSQARRACRAHPLAGARPPWGQRPPAASA